MKAGKQLILFALISVDSWLLAARPGDVMTELNIETTQLRQDVLVNLKAGKGFFFNATPSMRQLARRVPESSRATTVRALGKVIRAYVESAGFRDDWRQELSKTGSEAPADFRPLLMERIEQFITLTETVDFEARLVPIGNKQEFANPVYQRKPTGWKFLYRLGEGPVTEARLFAQQWLVDLTRADGQVGGH